MIIKDNGSQPKRKRHMCKISEEMPVTAALSKDDHDVLTGIINHFKSNAICVDACWKLNLSRKYLYQKDDVLY